MATINWVGKSGSWFDGANWSGGAVPHFPDGAVIDTPAPLAVTFDGETEVESLHLGRDKLTVAGQFDIYDEFHEDPSTLPAGSALVVTSGVLSLFGSASSAGTVKIARGASLVVPWDDGRTQDGAPAPVLAFTGGTYACNGSTEITGGTLSFVNTQITNLGTLLDLDAYQDNFGQIFGSNGDLGHAIASVHSLRLSSSKLTVDGRLTVLDTAYFLDDTNLTGTGEIDLKGSSSVSDYYNFTEQLSIGSDLLVRNEGRFFAAPIDIGRAFINEQGATFTMAGTVDGGPLINRGLLAGSGDMLAELENVGVVTVTGSIDLEGRVTGKGRMLIEDGGTLEVSGFVSGNQTIAFRSSDAQLQIDSSADFRAVLGGLSTGNTIHLAGVAATKAVIHDDRLVVYNGTAVADVLHLNRNYAAYAVSVSADENGGSLLTIGSHAGAAIAKTRV